MLLVEPFPELVPLAIAKPETAESIGNPASALIVLVIIKIARVITIKTAKTVCP
tara:strand:+ start:955 stop:1116 length:162 start_codon:yes stop_codon:yes gene_type:complete